MLSVCCLTKCCTAVWGCEQGEAGPGWRGIGVHTAVGQVRGSQPGAGTRRKVCVFPNSPWYCPHPAHNGEGVMLWGDSYGGKYLTHLERGLGETDLAPTGSLTNGCNAPSRSRPEPGAARRSPADLPRGCRAASAAFPRSLAGSWMGSVAGHEPTPCGHQC